MNSIQYFIQNIFWAPEACTLILWRSSWMALPFYLKLFKPTVIHLLLSMYMSDGLSISQSQVSIGWKDLLNFVYSMRWNTSAVITLCLGGWITQFWQSINRQPSMYQQFLTLDLKISTVVMLRFWIDGFEPFLDDEFSDEIIHVLFHIMARGL